MENSSMHTTPTTTTMAGNASVILHFSSAFYGKNKGKNGVF